MVRVPRGSRSRCSAVAVARGIGFLLPALALQACFDVHQGNPGDGHFVIDDFEDGDTLPKATPLFQQWTCFTFNPNIGQDPAQSVNNCNLESPGNASNYALVAYFTLHDPPAVSGSQFGGAGLTTTIDPVVDFNVYHNLVVSLRVDFGNLPPAAYAYVALDCNSVEAEKPKQPTDQFHVEQQIVATDTWGKQPFSLPLSKFVQPDYQTNRFAGGIQTCLAVIDSVNFQVSGQLTDDQSAHGEIHIDNISLE
jgi:hypothetical protein